MLFTIQQRASAQFLHGDNYTSVGLSIGTMNYYGDLSADDVGVLLQHTGLSLGLEANKRLNSRLSIRGNFSWGRLKGDDASFKGKNGGLYKRNLQFRNDIYELAATFELDLFRTDGHYTNRKIFDPYIFGGIAGFYHDPQAKTREEFGGIWVSLRALGTEGQGRDGYDKKYSKLGLAIPMGIGGNIKLMDKLDLGVEFSYRFTFTDYLDDVGGSYADKGVFGDNELARAMSDRSMEPTSVTTGEVRDLSGATVVTYTGVDGNTYQTISGYRPGVDKPRGNPATNDGYWFTSLHLRYILSKNRRLEDLSRIYHINSSHSHAPLRTVAPDYKKHVNRYEVEPLDINTEHNDLLPAIYRGGIVFVSDRHDKVSHSHRAKGKLYNIFYSPNVTFKREEITKPVKLETHGFEHHHLFSPSATVRGDKVFFSMYEDIDNSDHLKTQKIFTANVKGDYIWEKVEELPVNSSYYSVSHPALSRDGKTLYFVSDKEGGVGGTDIYISRKLDDHWTFPHNVSPPINTPGNEMFPFVHEDGTLYFASDGHNGIGGLDIFEVVRDNEGQIIRIANLGEPINSRYDDFGLVLDEVKRSGYFTSDRPGGMGKNDIYKLSVQKLNKSRQLTDDSDSLFNIQKITLRGKVIDTKTTAPIARAIVKLRNLINDDLLISRSDEFGNYSFEITNDAMYEIGCNVLHYKSYDNQPLSTIGVSNEEDIVMDFNMLPVDYEFVIKGTVMDKPTSEVITNAEILVLDLEFDTQSSVYTDEEGHYEIALKTNRSYMVFISEPGYKEKSFTVPTYNKKSSQKVVLNLKLEPAY